MAFDGKTIIAKGSPPYDLPASTSIEFFRCWTLLAPGDPCFIGEIAQEMTCSARRMLATLCTGLGAASETQQWWATAALSWAAVLNCDNRWKLDDFVPIYHARIDAGWAQAVTIMATGERFVITPRGVFTLPEFKWHYDQDLLVYLREQQTLQQAILESVIMHLSSPRQTVWVRLQDRNGQEAMHALEVLACQQVDDWAIPEGYTLISLV